MTLSRKPPPYTISGMHGYNNSDTDMRAIFCAFGPSFKNANGYIIPPINNLDVYSTVTKILGIYSAPNNGTALEWPLKIS